MSIVAKVYRGAYLDLTHIGHVAVVNHHGKLLYAYGDPNRQTFARSSAKPMQAIPAIESGAVDAFALTPQEIALLCASHSGEDFHLNTLMSILTKAHLSLSHLQCGTHMPFSAAATRELRRKGESPTVAHCNCSGKHAGMLITGTHLNESLDEYYKPEHPIQQRIIKTIAEVCRVEESQIDIGIDGCGVPVHALPLSKFAEGIARMTLPHSSFNDDRQNAITSITTAMTLHSEHVGGTDRFCSRLMQTCKGRLIAKSGAAGYYTVGILNEGIGMSFKIEDGTKDLVYGVVLRTLEQLDLITPTELDSLSSFLDLKEYNHKKEVVGHTDIAFNLTAF